MKPVSGVLSFLKIFSLFLKDLIMAEYSYDKYVQLTFL